MKPVAPTINPRPELRRSSLLVRCGLLAIAVLGCFACDEAAALCVLIPVVAAGQSRSRRSRMPQKRNTYCVLLVGRNRRTRAYLEELDQVRSSAIMVIGFLDREGASQNGRDDCEDLFQRLNLPHLGHLEDLATVLKDNPVDEVFITLPIKSCYDEIEASVRTCEEAGVAVSLSVDLFERSIAQAGFGGPGSSRITYSCVPYSRWRLAVKRAFDMGSSLAALIVLALPMLLIAMAIKLTSRGPVFFKQRRVGLNHRPFNMLKFRTMVQDAERLREQLEDQNEVDGPVFKIKKDPRVTPIGRFLRKFSLDELPQFFNILVGDMSVVGPRPPIPAEVAKYEWWQRRRLSMKPGLTCFWQVMGRNRVGFEEWMRLDLKYIDNWSLRLDAKLLLQTIPVVIRGSGAS